MVSRRSFLGLFGSATVAGPGVIQKSLSEELASPIGGWAMDYGVGLAPATDPVSNKLGWAKSLAKLAGKSERQKAEEKRRLPIYQFDPNISVLRSVSLVNKVRMSKDILYERNQERERTYLEGLIAGWWD